MSHPAITHCLQQRFGLDSLYPLQQQVIERVISGEHALVVLPTGSGKSLCFQLPALLRDGSYRLPADGVTLVFSPLIALMEDQVASLRKRDISAEYINSTLTREERIRRYRKLGDGDYDLIYATPERMHKPEFIEALARIPGGVRLLAIDEAHCITKWGHDFRPAYQRVGEFRQVLGNPTTIALTATATPEVRDDIRSTLGLSNSQMPLFASGIDRPNLSLESQDVWGEDDKLEAILDISKQAQGTGIVYFSLIKHLEEFATQLQRRNFPGQLEIYHGRLDPRDKKRVYERFSTAKPEQNLLLLATNAFGMGVDKADIRCIIHAEVPGSVESYYQEVGRAGRDGKSSRCVLLYDEQDLAIQQQFINWQNPEPELLDAAALKLQAAPNQILDVDSLRKLIIGRNRGDRRCEYCLITLEKLGVVERTPIEFEYKWLRPLLSDEIDPDEMAAKRERDLHRLLDMLKLVLAEDIRAYVLDYFGLDG